MRKSKKLSASQQADALIETAQADIYAILFDPQHMRSQVINDAKSRIQLQEGTSDRSSVDLKQEDLLTSVVDATVERVMALSWTSELKQEKIKELVKITTLSFGKNNSIKDNLSLLAVLFVDRVIFLLHMMLGTLYIEKEEKDNIIYDMVSNLNFILEKVHEIFISLGKFDQSDKYFKEGFEETVTTFLKDPNEIRKRLDFYNDIRNKMDKRSLEKVGGDFFELFYKLLRTTKTEELINVKNFTRDLKINIISEKSSEYFDLMVSVMKNIPVNDVRDSFNKISRELLMHVSRFVDYDNFEKENPGSKLFWIVYSYLSKKTVEELKKQKKEDVLEYVRISAELFGKIKVDFLAEISAIIRFFEHENALPGHRIHLKATTLQSLSLIIYSLEGRNEQVIQDLLAVYEHIQFCNLYRVYQHLLLETIRVNLSQNLVSENSLAEPVEESILPPVVESVAESAIQPVVSKLSSEEVSLPLEKNASEEKSDCEVTENNLSLEADTIMTPEPVPEKPKKNYYFGTLPSTIKKGKRKEVIKSFEKIFDKVKELVLKKECEDPFNFEPEDKKKFEEFYDVFSGLKGDNNLGEKYIKTLVQCCLLKAYIDFLDASTHDEAKATLEKAVSLYRSRPNTDLRSLIVAFHKVVSHIISEEIVLTLEAKSEALEFAPLKPEESPPVVESPLIVPPVEVEPAPQKATLAEEPKEVTAPQVTKVTSPLETALPTLPMTEESVAPIPPPPLVEAPRTAMSGSNANNRPRSSTYHDTETVVYVYVPYPAYPQNISDEKEVMIWNIGWEIRWALQPYMALSPESFDLNLRSQVAGHLVFLLEQAYGIAISEPNFQLRQYYIQWANGCIYSQFNPVLNLVHSLQGTLAHKYGGMLFDRLGEWQRQMSISAPHPNTAYPAPRF